MSSSPHGIVRHTFGWLLIAAALAVFCLPVVLIVRDWDRLGEANAPLLVISLVALCFVSFVGALLSVGCGVLRGRDRLVWNGILLFFGTFMAYVTLFAVFD